MKKLFVVFFLFLILAQCFAAIEFDSMKVFAVTDSGTAMAADLKLTLKPGAGKIWTGIEPLIGTSTQSTAKIAVDTANDYSDQAAGFDYFFEIDSDASLVEGPSAGAAMALLVISMLQDKVVPDNVGLTGTITTEGGVGPVGGVFEKSKEAARIGIKLFMVPSGESRQTVKTGNQVESINLIDYAAKNWGMKVVEVGNIDEVLRYAFADIESVDVNAEAGSAVEFVPVGIPLEEDLEPMKELTANYISEAEDSIRSAKTALSGTMLSDPNLVDLMLSNLNESEKTLAKAKILFDQNYLYSAANYAFLATVNSNFVRDIAENPALLATNSTAFNAKVDDLDKKINAFFPDLNQFVPIDHFEWHVAAKQRLSWAMLKVQKIKQPAEIVVVVENNGIDWQRVSDLLDYEYAVSWLEVSRDFFALTKDSQSGVAELYPLEGLADSFIANTKNSLNVLSEEETDDIQRRLESAELALGYGWVSSALFDSSSSFSLANTAIFSKNKSLEEMQNALAEKISMLEEKMQSSSRNFIWARLYLDHAKYYLDSSVFYQQHEQTGLASQSARAGLDLAFLAGGIFDATDASYAYFETVPESQIIQIKPDWQQQKTVLNDFISVLLLLLVLVAVTLVLGILGSSRKIHLFKRFSFEDRLEEILLEQRALNKRLEKGHISKEQFGQLNLPLQEKISKLLAERRAISADYVALDLNKCKVLAFQRALRDLDAELRKKQITAEDYKGNASFYKKKIALLKHLIEEEEKKIVAEKKEAASDLLAKEKKLKKKN